MTSTMKQESTKKPALIRAARSDVATEFTPRAAGHLEQHRHHGVGAEQPGQQHPWCVGLLHQPERDDDVEQHLVGAEDAVAGLSGEEAAVAQGAPG